MAIKIGVNGSKVEAKDIFVGVNSAKRKVVKVVTSVNGERTLLYGHEDPPQLEDYCYYISSQGYVKTKDFTTFISLISSPEYTLSHNVTDGTNVYVWDIRHTNPNYELMNCYVIDKRDTVTKHACVYNNPPTGTIRIVGQEHKIFFNGKIYDTIFVVNSGRDFYLVSSNNGYEWNIDTQLFSVGTSSYYNSILLDGISDGENHYLIFAKQVYSGNASALCAINLETNVVSDLVNPIHNSHEPEISVRISNNEILVHNAIPYSSSNKTNNTYNVKLENGRVTATACADSIWKIPTLFYSDGHFYGGASRAVSAYYDTNAKTMDYNFGNMVITENGVFAFDVSGGLYAFDAAGNLEKITVVSNAPMGIYTNIFYPNMLVVKR